MRCNPGRVFERKSPRALMGSSPDGPFNVSLTREGCWSARVKSGAVMQFTAAKEPITGAGGGDLNS